MIVENLNLNRLIECRKKSGLTKQEIARRINVAQPTYVRYESGERKPSIHVLRDIAAVLGTSAAYLTGETKSKKPDSILIQSQDEPELYDLVIECRDFDSEKLGRVLKYCQKIK